MAEQGENPQRSRVSQVLAVVAIIAAATVLIASAIQGPPTPLPEFALGWPLVLYLERAGLVALLITGVGGTLHRLLTGGQVSGSGGGPLPNLDVEDATKPTEALKEGVEADIEDLAGRMFRVEKELEGLKPTESANEREE